MRFRTGIGLLTERARSTKSSRPGAKGAGQMRTLWELESEGGDLIINDPMDEGGDLGNQPINDPDD